MSNSMYAGGPVLGLWTQGFVSGIVLKHIGRGSGGLGYFIMYSAETATTCGTSGTDWFATYSSGIQSYDGDSGSGVGVSVSSGGQNGVLIAGIQWGITTRNGLNTIIMTPWSSVTSALGIQNY